MARMLGRFESPGHCAPNREGWVKRHRWNLRGDCDGAATDTRWRKRVEQRAFARELRPEGLLPTALDDPTACLHDCHGECLTTLYGLDGDGCRFWCHADGSPSEADYLTARARLAAEIWPGGSLERAARERLMSC